MKDFAYTATATGQFTVLTGGLEDLGYDPALGYTPDAGLSIH